MRKVELLPTRECEAGYGPAIIAINIIDWSVYNDVLYKYVLPCAIVTGEVKFVSVLATCDLHWLRDCLAWGCTDFQWL